MSATVTEIVPVEAATVEAKPAGKKRDLARIGKNLARQQVKRGWTGTIEDVMEQKLVDRAQAKAIVAHATKTLEARGKTFVLSA
jgi:predicted nucleic acid-binding Zn ribbon protein